MPIGDDIFNYNYFKRRQRVQKSLEKQAERKRMQEAEQEEKLKAYVPTKWEPKYHLKPDGSVDLWKHRRRFLG